jgi:hypothetical protein
VRCKRTWWISSFHQSGHEGSEFEVRRGAAGIGSPRADASWPRRFARGRARSPTPSVRSRDVIAGGAIRLVEPDPELAAEIDGATGSRGRVLAASPLWRALSAPSLSCVLAAWRANYAARGQTNLIGTSPQGDPLRARPGAEERGNDHLRVRSANRRGRSLRAVSPQGDRAGAGKSRPPQAIGAAAGSAEEVEGWRRQNRRCWMRSARPDGRIDGIRREPRGPPHDATRPRVERVRIDSGRGAARGRSRGAPAERPRAPHGELPGRSGRPAARWRVLIHTLR